MPTLPSFHPGLKAEGAPPSSGYCNQRRLFRGPLFKIFGAQRYDDFLFAPVCEDTNGMRLSVLSALARTDVDPWEEATRLAAMPKALAEKTLVSILDLVSDRNWKSLEAAAIAARLVRLLPRPGEAASVAATANATTAAAHRKTYWWVWVGFWVAMSLIMPHHHQAATTNAGAVTSESGATSPIKSGAADPVSLTR